MKNIQLINLCQSEVDLLLDNPDLFIAKHAVGMPDNLDELYDIAVQTEEQMHSYPSDMSPIWFCYLAKDLDSKKIIGRF